MTWTCATVATREPDGCFADYVQHGLAILRRMRHDPTGAYHWEVDLGGRPCGDHAGASLAYGQAFAVLALSAAAGVLRSDEALAAAKGVFAWLERAHYDRQRGGFFEYVSLSGRPVTRSRTLRRHAIGGYKTSDTHLHLMEALVALHRLWPDSLLGRRIEELVALLTERWWLAPGHVHSRARLDCQPLSDAHSCGHDVEIAHLILEAAEVLGRPRDPFLFGRAKALLDCAIAESWDDAEGGFFDGDAQIHGPAEASKIWWVQAEALACVAALSAATSDPNWRALLDRQWQWIRDRQIDNKHGGWIEAVGRNGLAAGKTAKGHPWKEIYHEVRAALVLSRALGAGDSVLVREARSN
jgi:mannobiose 2-epimerase